MKVLLIEPDRLMARMERQALEQDGHTVQWRQTAQAGLDGLDHELPDIVILETQLGLHNGIEFLYELRSYPEWHGIPVAIYSINQAVTHSVFGPAFRKLGVVSVLYKPTASLASLCRIVNQQTEVLA